MERKECLWTPKNLSLFSSLSKYGFNSRIGEMALASGRKTAVERNPVAVGIVIVFQKDFSGLCWPHSVA